MPFRAQKWFRRPALFAMLVGLVVFFAGLPEVADPMRFYGAAAVMWISMLGFVLVSQSVFFGLWTNPRLKTVRETPRLAEQAWGNFRVCAGVLTCAAMGGFLSMLPWPFDTKWLLLVNLVLSAAAIGSVWDCLRLLRNVSKAVLSDGQPTTPGADDDPMETAR